MRFESRKRAVTTISSRRLRPDFSSASAGAKNSTVAAAKRKRKTRVFKCRVPWTTSYKDPDCREIEPNGLALSLRRYYPGQVQRVHLVMSQASQPPLGYSLSGIDRHFSLKSSWNSSFSRQEHRPCDSRCRIYGYAARLENHFRCGPRWQLVQPPFGFSMTSILLPSGSSMNPAYGAPGPSGAGSPAHFTPAWVVFS